MGRTRLFALFALLTLTGFITTLDNTVINVALPTVQRELGLSVTDLEWVASSYVLSFGALLLPGGRLTDLFGPPVRTDGRAWWSSRRRRRPRPSRTAVAR